MTDLGENFICEARAIGDRHWCGRCNLSFESTAKAKPPCRPAADIARVLPTLAIAAETEAVRIDGSIDAAVGASRLINEEARSAGEREPLVAEPSRELLRQAAALRRLAWLARACAADATIMERLRRAAS